jgi:electron transfer flavoprotein beta subunit
VPARMSSVQRWAVAVKHGVDVNLTRADPVSGEIDLTRAPRKTSDFDKNAVEEAVRLREKNGGTVTAVSVGPTTARDAIRDALAMGADEGVLLVAPPGIEIDSNAVAAFLAAYFRTPSGQFDLALFGEGSTDHFSGTVGPRVAALLGLPSLCHARHVAIDGERLNVRCDLETGVEELETGFPAVVTVGQEINSPRLPTFLNTAKASKKQIREIPASSLEVTESVWKHPATVRQVSVPSMPRKRVRVTGANPSAIAQQLVLALHDEGIDRT